MSLNFTEIELQKIKNPDKFEYAIVDIDHTTRTLVKRNLQWVWLQDVLAALPVKKAVYIPVPEGHTSQEFVAKVRVMTAISWNSTRNMRFSIRQSEKRDAIYVLKADELPRSANIEERLNFWDNAILPPNPSPLTESQKKDAKRRYRASINPDIADTVAV